MRSLAMRLGIDFQRARHQINELTEYAAATRARALAAYVALFDLADGRGVLAVPTTELAVELEIGRPAWTLYRDVLELAGLLKVDAPRGGALRQMQLIAPT